MRIYATNQHSVLFHKAETRRGFTGSSKYIGVACATQKSKQPVALRSDARAPSKRVERHTLAEQKMADWATDCGAVRDGLKGSAFFDMPLDADKGSNL